jgi:hypothetical protein
MPLPAQHISDSWNSAEFYANKLMMALKGKDEAQIAWLKAIKVGCLGFSRALGGSGCQCSTHDGFY